MVDTFQSTRQTRLLLAHQSSQSYAERVPTQSYVSDNAENLTTVRSHGVSYLPSMNQLGPSNYFVYDGEGNPTDFNGNAATFDEENRMTSLGSSFSAVYRADGMRAWKTTNTGKVSYVYDVFGHPVLETVNNQVTAINSFGANGLTSRRSGGSSTFYTFDAFGNTSQRLDSSGAVLSTHACDEYGMVQSTPSAPNDPFYGYGAQFGNYLDTSTGLYLMGHRYYDAYYARFVNADPIGLGGGVNEYAYVADNPLVGIDPSGQQVNPNFHPEPPGGPPFDVPWGPGLRWKRVPGTGSRPNKWIPERPVKVPGGNGSQPNTSWDDYYGHWDTKLGDGTTLRYPPGVTDPMLPGLDHLPFWSDLRPKGPEWAPGPRVQPRPTTRTVITIDVMGGLKGGAIAVGAAAYFFVSEASRVLCPPRNMVPVW